MNQLRGLAALALTLGCLLPAHAGGEVGDFNFNETTGLINIPVARVVPAGSVQLSLGAHDLDNGQGPTGIDADDALLGNDGNARLIAGLPGRVEISVMALHGGFFKNNHYVFGAKWLAIPDGPDHPGFAIGVQSLNNTPQVNNPHPAHFDTPSAFGVVSHSFPLNDSGMALDLHAGIGTGRLRDGFAGGEFHLIPELSLVGETDGTIESVGFRVTPGKRFQLLASAQLQDPIRYGVMISYLFGPTEDEDEVAETYENPPPADPKAGTTRVVPPQELEPNPEPAPEPGSGSPQKGEPSPEPEATAPLPANEVRAVVAVAPAVVAPPEPSPVARTPEKVATVQPMRLLKRDRMLRMPLQRR